MRTVGDVYRAMNELAPFDMAKKEDNVGLLIGSKDNPVSKVLLAMDATHKVIEEAIKIGAELIVTHHPIIFNPLARIESESVVYAMIRNGISAISAHTNLDIAGGGVNDCLAQRLGLENIRALDISRSRPYYKVVVFVPDTHLEAVYSAMSSAGGGSIGEYSGCAFTSDGEGRFMPNDKAEPFIGKSGVLEKVKETALEMVVSPDRLGDLLTAMKRAHPYEEPAHDVFHNHAAVFEDSMGRVGDLLAPVDPDSFAQQVKKALGVGAVKYTLGEQPISVVAVCGGSGGGYLRRAKSLGAQALVVGETRHKELLEANALGMTLIDAGHFCTETVVMEPLRNRLRLKLAGISIDVAASNTDPTRYK